MQKQITLAPLREDGERIAETFTLFEFRRKALPTRFVYFADNPTKELAKALLDAGWWHATVTSSALGFYVLTHSKLHRHFLALSPKPEQTA